jgi:hypothetical protein
MSNDTQSGSADFGPLGNMEITKAGDIFAQCEFIRVRASNSGLIIMQWASDVQYALASVPVLDPGGWHGIGADDSAKRARRVARHAYRSAESLKAAAQSAAKLPPAYLKAYNDIINNRRKRPTFDPQAGL